MADQLPLRADADPVLRRLREYVAAGIAIVVIIGTLVLLFMAFLWIETDQAFARAKDLLLVINPIVGVVIGYYFNKASTEARAEHAEATAQAAAATTNQAVAERNQAIVQAHQAQARSDEVMTTLTDVDQAAAKMLAQMPKSTAEGVLGASDESAERARLELEFALQRAHRLMQR